MRKYIPVLVTFVIATFWAADASAQLRRPGAGSFFQPRPRPANARSAQLEMADAPSELDLHLSVAQLDGGLILGGIYTRNITDVIGVEGGFDHDHGNSRYGEKVLVYGDMRWKISPSASAGRAYMTAGVAAGGGYSYALTPFIGVSGRGNCAEPMCLRYDLTLYPAVDNVRERFRGSVGFSVSLR